MLENKGKLWNVNKTRDKNLGRVSKTENETGFRVWKLKVWHHIAQGKYLLVSTNCRRESDLVAKFLRNELFCITYLDA